VTVEPCGVLNEIRGSLDDDISAGIAGVADSHQLAVEVRLAMVQPRRE